MPNRGELIAMGGERSALDDYPEISGVCTHPAYRGNGYASGLTGSSREIIAGTAYYPGSMPAANHQAITLYLRLGFKAVRMVTLHRISRTSGVDHG